jgi:aspartate/methionine/tyrosine aminotransferase
MFNEQPHFEFALSHPHIKWLSQNTNQLVDSACILETVIKDVHSKKYIGYTPPYGIAPLRKKILSHLNLSLDQDAFITQGATEAINVVMRFIFKEGGELITSDPGYGPIADFAKMAGAVVKKLPIYQEPYHLTPDQIEEAITPATKAIVIVDPGNPLGKAYCQTSLKEIIAIAKKYHLYLIHDITYYDFASTPYLVAHDYPELTFTIYSLSKCAALAGLRLGAVMARPALLDGLKTVWAANLGSNIFSQDIALAMLESFDDWFVRVKEISNQNQATIVKQCNALPGVFFPVKHSSANVFVIDISGTGLDSFYIQEKLLFDHHVFIRNGHYTSKQFGAQYIRLSFSNPPEDIDCFCKAFKEVIAKGVDSNAKCNSIT